MIILVINPGSTSTKIAVYDNTEEIYEKNLKHSSDELNQFDKITDQYYFRKSAILEDLKKADLNIEDINCVVGRGGLVKPIPSGVYEVNDQLLKDLKQGVLGEHASNLGGLIANDLAGSNKNTRAFIADPVVVDELEDIARYTGHPLFKRISIFHALNQKAVARTYAADINRNYEDLNLIVAHLGGGISVGAHKKGKVVDVNNTLNGDGPFSPERSGTLPVGQLIKLCFSGNYTEKEMNRMIKGEGGFVAYLGTNNAYEVELKVRDGDNDASLVQDAMSYQISKEIGSLAVVFAGEIDAILLTGGLAKNPLLTEYIEKMVSFIAPVHIYPGENELRALAMNGLMAMNQEIEIKIYE